MLIRERLGRLRGKFKGGPGSLGVFAASGGSPSTRQPNTAHTLLRAPAPSPSSVASAQTAPPRVEYQIVARRNAAREDHLRADVRVGSPSEDPLCEPVDNRGGSTPLTVSSLRPAVSSPADPVTHASAPITNSTSPPAYTSIDGADKSPSQVASEPVVPVGPLRDDDLSGCVGAGGKDRFKLGVTPNTLAIPSDPQPMSTLPSQDVGNVGQIIPPSLSLSTTAPISSLSATSRIADMTAGSKLAKCTYIAYLSDWDTRPLFPLYFVSILVLLVPLII